MVDSNSIYSYIVNKLDNHLVYGDLSYRWERSSKMTGKLKLYTVIVLALLGLVTVSPAYANIGAPMIFLVWPASWALLLLIIPTEAVVCMRVMRVRYSRALKVVGVANLASTLIGIPITWILLVGIEMLMLLAMRNGLPHNINVSIRAALNTIIMSPWVAPFEGEYWLVPASCGVLCVPFFFMSVWAENLAARRFFKKEQHGEVKRWAWLANGLTYGVIIAILTVMTIIAIQQHGVSSYFLNQ